MEKECILKDKRIVGSPAVHLISMIIMLFAFWLALTGKVTVKFLIYGIITSVAAAWVTYPLLLVSNKDNSRSYFVFGVPVFKFIGYSGWLLWQLILANIDVARATTGQNLNINPRIIRFRFTADNPMAYVVLANSITLTPGTVTLNVTDDGLYEIHALTDGAADGVLCGEMQKRVAELFNEKLDFAVVEEENKS